MWLRNCSVSVLLGLGLLLSPASAQQTIRWQWSLESALQLAGQTNRLVLVHFWADWCGPCKRMEQEVFAHPEVVAALEANYVPVKINRDHLPATAREFGITSIPAEVILTPQRRIVERFQGYTMASQYVGRLNRVAAAYRTQNDHMYAQISGSRPAMGSGPAVPPAGSPGYPGGQASNYPGPGYVPASGAQGYADNRQAPMASPPPNQPYANMPPGYGQHPAQQQDPLLPQQPPQTTGPMAPAMPPQGHAGMNVPPAMNMPTNAGPSPTMGPQMNPPSPMAGPMAPGTPSSRAVEVPPGNPPLALDGYCPVVLTEKERWVRGNPRWGVRHEGRTYLFAGPEEQSRFYADPNRYAPVIGGDDVVMLVEQGQRVPGQREFGGWFQNRVYLFSSEATFQRFYADPQRYASAAEQMRNNIAARGGSGRPN